VDFSDSENFFKKIFFDFELDFLKSSFFVQTLSSNTRRRTPGNGSLAANVTLPVHPRIARRCQTTHGM
jgi:hypothetical protein